jgi:molecular chaperone IbpA
MRTFDLAPLMRSSVGFDHLNRLMDSATRRDTTSTFPPYNIEKLGEDDYQISIAVAGFSRDELDITLTDGMLIVSGSSADDDDDSRFIHRGIAKRSFERRFQLAETIEVVDASFDHGMLKVNLKRVVPEHLLPRNIKIKEQKPKNNKVSLEDKAA